MGFELILGIIIGGGIGVIAGATLLYLVSDELRWHNFLLSVEGFLDNRATRWLFDTSIGKWVNRKTIESYIRRGDPRKAQELAIREGLVDETLAALTGAGLLREAGALSRRTGRDERAETLYRQAIDLLVAEGREVLAAEVAEEAEFWAEAVELMAGLQSRESRLHAARIAASHGMPQTAVEIYLREEAVMDAMRVGEEHGQVEFVLRFCEESKNPVLHQFAADAAKRTGDPERGLRILEAHGNLHQAAMFAKEAGMTAKAKELFQKLRDRDPHPGLAKMDGI